MHLKLDSNFTLNTPQVNQEARITAEQLLDHPWLGEEQGEAIRARKEEKSAQAARMAQEEEELRLVLEMSTVDS